MTCEVSELHAALDLRTSLNSASTKWHMTTVMCLPAKQCKIQLSTSMACPIRAIKSCMPGDGHAACSHQVAVIVSIINRITHECKAPRLAVCMCREVANA